VSATPSVGTWTAPSWTIGNFANGANAALTITATVNASGPYTNTATITGNQTDPTSSNNTSGFTDSRFITDLSVTKIASNTPAVGVMLLLPFQLTTLVRAMLQEWLKQMLFNRVYL
jgi:hypothetical protein